MKRRHLLLVALGLILTICMCFSLACGKSKKKDDPVTLSAPVVSVDNTNGKATWDEVENASGYVYKINNGEEKTDATKTDGKYTVQLSDGQSIQVKALGDGTNYKDSAWSTVKTYNVGGEHTCNDPCPTCGKCLTDCEEPECSQKCPKDHGSADSDYGTLDNPLSVEQALALADKECVENNAYTKQVVYMTGKLTNVPTERTNNSGVTYYQSLYLADLADSSKSILVYSLNLDEEVAAPAQNDTLVVCGYIQNYLGNTIEFTSNGDTYVLLKDNVRGTSTITLGSHEGATVSTIPETSTNGTEISFTVTPDSGKEVYSVNVNGNELEAEDDGVTYKFILAGNTNIIVTTVDEGAADNYITATLNIGTYAAAHEWVDGNASGPAYTTVNIDDKITATAGGGGSNGKYYVSDKTWRFYANGTLTISAATNYKLVSIKITFTNGSFSDDITSGVAKSVVGTSVTLTASSTLRVLDIEVVYESGTVSDADKVLAEKNAYKFNGETRYSEILDSIQLDNESGEASLTWSVENAADKEWIDINNNVLSIKKLPDEDEHEVTITVEFKIGEATAKKDIVITLVASNVKGTKSNPYTAAEALAAAKTLGSGAYSEDPVYVTGYVIELGSWSGGSYNNFTNTYIADSISSTKTSEDAFAIYRLYADGTYITGETDLKLGAKITVYGYITNYSGNTPQMAANNNVNPKAVAFEDPSDEAKVYFALKALNDTLPDVKKAENVTLPVSTIDGVTFKWSSDNDTYKTDDAGLILLVAALPAAEVTVTLTVVATCGSVNSDNTKTVTVIIQKAPDENDPTPPTITWTLVTDINDLAAGDKILLVYKDGSTVCVNDALYSTNKYLDADKTSYTLSSDGKTLATVPDKAETVALTLGKSDTNWTLTSDGKLIGLSSNANGSMTVNSGTTTWTISINSSGVAQIASTLADSTNTCRLQYNTSSPRFTNYKTSTQKDPSIYKRVES